MIAEFNIAGVYIPSALISAMAAGVCLFTAKKLLHSLRIYQFFWHRYIVDLGLFLALWAAAAFLIALFPSSTGSL
jgi:hypothetical protein